MNVLESVQTCVGKNWESIQFWAHNELGGDRFAPQLAACPILLL